MVSGNRSASHGTWVAGVAFVALFSSACTVIESAPEAAYPGYSAYPSNVGYPPQSYVVPAPAYIAPAYVAPVYPSAFYAPTIIVPAPVYIAPRPAIVAVAPPPRILPPSLGVIPSAHPHPHGGHIVRPPSLLPGLPGQPHAGHIVRPPSISPPAAPLAGNHGGHGGFMHTRPSPSMSRPSVNVAPPSSSGVSRSSGQRPSRWR
jgi:hypothetical protein